MECCVLMECCVPAMRRFERHAEDLCTGALGKPGLAPSTRSDDILQRPITFSDLSLSATDHEWVFRGFGTPFATFVAPFFRDAGSLSPKKARVFEL